MTVQSTIIGIIVVIISAAVIFIFLRAVPFQETVDKEACHNSVILRSQSLIGYEPGKAVVPLSCKTQNIKIETSSDDVIKQELANQMYDCWWMLGEGKLDFMPDEDLRDVQINWQNGIQTAQANCIICSTIKFGDNAKGKQLDLVNYIADTPVPSKNITYLEYFTQQKGVKLPTLVEVNKVDTNNDYAIIFMNIKGGSFWNALKAYGGLMGGGAIAGFKIGRLAGPDGMLIGTAIGAGVGEFIGNLNAIKEFGNARVAATRCDGSYKGCSNLFLIPLTATDLTTTCNNIESIP